MVIYVSLFIKQEYQTLAFIIQSIPLKAKRYLSHLLCFIIYYYIV